jgi:dihydrofolate reductase
MGRKTWNSIPVPFRPLKDRKNVVISRQSLREAESEGSIHASSIEDAVGLAEISSERIFVIGGAQIYEEALRKEQARRILLTRILTDFECDTFLPITLGEDGKADGWERKSKEELDAWVGETVAEGVQEEHGAKYVFEMWERIERNAN